MTLSADSCRPSVFTAFTFAPCCACNSPNSIPLFNLLNATVLAGSCNVLLILQLIYIYAHITGFLCNYARQITFSACICKQSRCCVSMKINLATGWTLNLANTLYTMQNKLFAKIKMSTLQLRISWLGGGGERDRFLPLVPTSTDSTL